MFDNPAAALGYDVGDVTNRAASGRIVPNLTLTSARRFLRLDGLDLAAALATLGLGRRPSRQPYLPALRYVGNEETDFRGYAAVGIPFEG